VPVFAAAVAATERGERVTIETMMRPSVEGQMGSGRRPRWDTVHLYSITLRAPLSSFVVVVVLVCFPPSGAGVGREVGSDVQNDDITATFVMTWIEMAFLSTSAMTTDVSSELFGLFFPTWEGRVWLFAVCPFLRPSRSPSTNHSSSFLRPTPPVLHAFGTAASASTSLAASAEAAAAAAVGGISAC
jgi:hypothetical protein